VTEYDSIVKEVLSYPPAQLNKPLSGGSDHYPTNDPDSFGYMDAAVK